MIIYQNNVKNFIKDCEPKNTDSLIAEIKTNMLEKMGRGVSQSEERSWRTTLVKISEFFKQIKEKEKQYILLEFKVPTSQKRIDVILVGSDGKRNTLLIIELKGWSSSKKSEIKGTLKINAIYGNSVLHPNYEAEEYKYLLTQQFSDINKEFPIIKAISLLPNYEVIKNDPILSKDFEDILKTIDLYTKTDVNQFIKLLQSLFKKGIPRNKVDFLNKLEYKPTLDFQRHLENEFEKIRLSQSQFLSYKIVINEIANHLKNPKNKKLIIISGMPGSGKTIVAFKILAYIYTQLKITAKLQLPGPEFREAIKNILIKIHLKIWSVELIQKEDNKSK